MSSEPPPHGVYSDVLSSPPFIVVPGVFNVRAFSGIPADGNQKRIKPLHVFRSGELTRITDDGQSKLRELGVAVIFDLRSINEIAQFQSATPDIPGIRVVRAPALTEDAWKADLPELLQRYKEDELNVRTCLISVQHRDHPDTAAQAHLNSYAKILQMAGPSYGLIFAHLRDHPSEPCLVHCTVGKDRTGLFAALFYLLMGVSDDDIIQDYALSTVGLAPSTPALEVRFRSIPVYRDNWEGLMKMGSARAETMIAVLSMIREKFGGVEGYLRTHAGLTYEDLATIQGNMLV